MRKYLGYSYSYNEHCFDKLNKESLYWLGLLYADGNIHKQKFSNSYCVTLSLRDEKLVKKFQQFISPDKPVRIYKNNCGNPMFCFTCCNSKINNKLLFLGLLEKKSLTLQFPDFLKKHPLVFHFIRGYFDGDGCISEKQHKHKTWLHFSMVGTKNMMQNIQDIIYQHLQSHPRKLVKQGKVYSLHIGKINDVKQLQKLLYQHSSVFMERKKEIFDQHSELKTGTSSPYKNICFRPYTQRWRATFYQNGQRKEKGFSTVNAAYRFLKKINKTKI